MRQVKWQSAAEVELIHAAGWYESRQQGLGREFIEQIDAVVGAIREVPESFPLWHKRRAFRRAIVPRFPYVVFFTVEEELVRVFALAHQRRRAAGWAERLARSPSNVETIEGRIMPRIK